MSLTCTLTFYSKNYRSVHWVRLIYYNICNVPTSAFYRLIVIVTFQHVNRTFNVIFDSFKSHCLTYASMNRMFRSITYIF